MEFRRFGKSFQMVIRDGRDLQEALTLDESLWVALSAPVGVFKCDPKLLEYMDAEKKGRITSTDVRNAIKYLLAYSVKPENITADFDGRMPVAELNGSCDEGKQLLDAANWIIRELKPGDGSAITLEQVRLFLGTVISRPLNGDGVLTEKAAQEASTDALKAEVALLVKNVVAATGGALDVDGSKGLDEKTLADFLAAVPAFLAWHDRGQLSAGQGKSDIMVMGADTAAKYALLKENCQRIDQFFKISRLLDFDNRLLPKALSPNAKVEALDPTVQAEVDAYQAALPIAEPSIDRVLPLDAEKINPAYRSWFAKLVEGIVVPVLGNGGIADGINQSEWESVKAAFAPYEAYLASKQGAIVEGIPVAELRKYGSCDELLAEVRKLIGMDKDVANKIVAAKKMEQLILYRKYLVGIANNFISFTDLYSPGRHAMFECGKLVIDGRWFTVAFRVDTPAAHLALAKSSQMFLIYLEVTGNSGKYNIVVPVTNGDKGGLQVGKRGIFYDNDGVDCDAKITQIQENPICIKEALMAPFPRLWAIVEGKINAWSGNAEKNLQTNFTKAITPEELAKQKAAAAPVPKDGKGGSGAFMGIGIAVAAVGSAFAFITKTISEMSWSGIFTTVLVALLVLMMPIAIIAIIKLKRQDLSAVLEGCGWGINMRVRIDRQLRDQFTYYSKYPAGAKGTPVSYWLRNLLIVILVALCIAGGIFWRRQCQACQAEKAKAAALNCEAPAVSEAEAKAEVVPEAK